MIMNLTEHEKTVFSRSLQVIKDYLDSLDSDGTLAQGLAVSSANQLLCEVVQAKTEPAKVFVYLGEDCGNGDYQASGNVQVYWLDYDLKDCAEHGVDSFECTDACNFLTDTERLDKIPAELR